MPNESHETRFCVVSHREGLFLTTDFGHPWVFPYVEGTAQELSDSTMTGATERTLAKHSRRRENPRDETGGPNELRNYRLFIKTESYR